jgi:phosphomannomutase
METAVKVFSNAGIKVKMARGFVSTPMVSLAAVKLGCSIGVVITASHNPPSYNGFKLKSEHGGPLSPEKVQEIEDIIPDNHGLSINELEINDSLVEVIDLETMYVDHARCY